MRTTKILGIAPYKGMENLMRQTAEKRTDIDLTVFVGDLESGAEIARRYSNFDFDIILSRGGTAELIRSQTTLPVVDIPLSVYDILRSIKLAENYNSRYAIIGFPAITKNAKFLCELLCYDIDIYTIHTQDEARRTLEHLEAEGCNMVLCDVVTNSLAHDFGISAMLITSGAESMEAAMDLAVQESRAYQELNRQTLFFRTILETQPQQVFVYDETDTPVYSSQTKDLPSILFKKISSCLTAVREEKQKKVCIETGGKLYTLYGRSFNVENSAYVVFSVYSRRAPFSMEKHGITFLSRKEAFDSFFSSFYGITQSTSPAGMTLEQYAQSSQPLVLLGEIGTGKDQMARLLYGKSTFSSNPLITIDCSRLENRGWEFLMENDHSPLTDTGNTIYFKQIGALTDQQFDELFSTIKDLHGEQHNRLIFCSNYQEQSRIEPRFRRLNDLFSCLTLVMPPLRSHRQDVPSLASLYISTLNMRTAKSVIGFEPDAAQMMKDYDWPGNYDQFKRILNELVLMTDTPYISLESVQGLLKREQLMYGPPIQPSFDLDRTLEEINLDILQQVLAQEGGNQSKTARRLGISRTTMWRMLQKSQVSDLQKQ